MRGRSSGGLLDEQASRRSGVLQRLGRFPWGLAFLILLLTGMGLVVLYSAMGSSGASGALRQGARFGVALVMMLAMGVMGDKFFRRWAYFFYGLVLLMLIAVGILGVVGMGAQRWIELGFFRLQPSEFMKAALVLGLARFYYDQGVSHQFGLQQVFVPGIMIVIPVFLVFKQPDLGTALLLGMTGMVVVFMAGLPWRAVVGAIIGFAAFLPLAWNFLREYQQQRVITLFFPERDPLGAGYHIIQSKIAVGAGGWTGKGFMAGSQSQLRFLPEQHTDFIFSVLAEEWGFLGAISLIILNGFIVLYGFWVAANARDRFGTLLASGVTVGFSIPMMVNLGMVLGLMPVVGMPLPLVSYGGSSMLSIMIGMGLLAHVSVHSRFNE